jgi:hypothetical protein
MTSASILVAMGAGEQPKARPMSEITLSDQGELKGLSFAKSFNERVQVAGLAQGESPAAEVAIALAGLKNVPQTKKSDEAADMPTVVKRNAISARERFAHGELKSAVAAKMSPPEATTVGESNDKTTADDSGTKTVALPAQMEEIADDVSPSSSIPYAKPTVGATPVGSVSQDSIADGNHPAGSRCSEPTLLKSIRTAETEKEGVIAKKIAKAQEGEAAPKIVEKTVGAVAPTVTLEAKPIAGNSVADGIIAAGQAIAPQSEKKGISKTADVFGKADSAVSKASIAFSSATVNGLVRNDPAAGVKTSVTNTQMTATAGSDLTPPPKGGAGPENVAAIAIPGDSDGENKLKAAPTIGTALLHSMGIEPITPVPGNATGELGAIRLPVGDVGAHAGLLTGTREQDAPGVVAQSMDGAPRMLTATPTSLEVGIQNGTHGWLKVRAEMADGVVNASVSAASSVGQQMLHRELPALTAYLQEEKVGVNAVVVHTPTTAATDARNSSAMDGGGGGGMPQRNDEGDVQQKFRNARLEGFDETMTHRGQLGVDEDGSLPLAAYVRGGNWLSVRA